jgi:diguanylate cyclase (GGDEF)-like protein
MESKIDLIVQLAGVFLIAILTMCLRRSIKVAALKYWATAWLFLCFALICLRLASSYDHFSPSLISLYFLGQYLFAFMLIAGCKCMDRDTDVSPLSELLLIPIAILSIGLPIVATDVSASLSLHSATLTGFFVGALVALRRSRMRTFGWKVMHVSIGFLILYHLAGFAAYLIPQQNEIARFVIDYDVIMIMVIQTALGFGMVIVLLERILADSRTVNEQLEGERQLLEKLVHTDPLTTAFNRHAFYGFVRKGGQGSEANAGCVGFFDIDDLKWINDRYGHAVGDNAIRAVVRAIREVIRAEDLIYRWGGDEFFVIMISMNAQMARVRMQKLEALLTNIMLTDMTEPITIGVSCGFTDYEGGSNLEHAIGEADSEMYRRKQNRKRLRQELEGALIPPAEHTAVFEILG